MKKLLFAIVLLSSCEVKPDPNSWERICIYEEMEKIDYILNKEIQKENPDRELIFRLLDRIKELTEKRITLK